MRIIRAANWSDVAAAMAQDHDLPRVCVICGDMTTTYASAVQRDGSTTYYCAECME